jgi:hypothetical protein
VGSGDQNVASNPGNKQHSGGVDEALIVVNAKTDELWVWLKVKGALRRFGPSKDPAGMPADPVTALKDMQQQ